MERKTLSLPLKSDLGTPKNGNSGVKRQTHPVAGFVRFGLTDIFVVVTKSSVWMNLMSLTHSSYPLSFLHITQSNEVFPTRMSKKLEGGIECFWGDQSCFLRVTHDFIDVA